MSSSLSCVCPRNDKPYTVWFSAALNSYVINNNFMKLNTDKCHFLILGRNSNQHITVNVGDSVIENTEEEKLLGVVIDKTNF